MEPRQTSRSRPPASGLKRGLRMLDGRHFEDGSPRPTAPGKLDRQGKLGLFWEQGPQDQPDRQLCRPTQVLAESVCSARAIGKRPTSLVFGLEPTPVGPHRPEAVPPATPSRRLVGVTVRNLNQTASGNRSGCRTAVGNLGGLFQNWQCEPKRRGEFQNPVDPETRSRTRSPACQRSWRLVGLHTHVAGPGGLVPKP